MKSTCLALGVVTLALWTVPAIAPAASDHTGSLDATKSVFEWDSKTGTGFTTLNTLHDGKVPCGTAVVHDCDETLLHVTGCGNVTVTNTQTSPTAVDTDLYSYYSDANGDKVAAGPSSSQSSPTPNEAVSLDTAAPDSYILVEIDYTDYVAMGVHAKATFTPADPTTVDPSTCEPLNG